jgi:hypothetical protein
MQEVHAIKLIQGYTKFNTDRRTNYGMKRVTHDEIRTEVIEGSSALPTIVTKIQKEWGIRSVTMGVARVYIHTGDAVNCFLKRTEANIL